VCFVSGYILYSVLYSLYWLTALELLLLVFMYNYRQYTVANSTILRDGALRVGFTAGLKWLALSVLLVVN